MTTTTAWISKQGTDSTQARSGIATIDAAETATLAIPCHGRGVVRLQFPGTFTGTTVTFTVQPYRPDDPANKTANPSFTTLYDGAGNAVTKTVGTNRVINVPELSGAYAFTIVSGSTEGSARQIGVSMFGLEPGVPPLDSITIGTGTVTVLPTTGTLTDRSGAVTSGGVAQTLAAINTARKYLIVNNPSTAALQGIAAAESLFINFTTAAVAGHPSIEILPGGSLVMEASFVSTELVSVVAATTAHAWTAKEA